MKCPEKYIKAYIFVFLIINQWIEFNFENVKYISLIYLRIFKKIYDLLCGNNLT